MLLESLSYLHSHGVVHNDIRPSLAFLDVGGALKLGGFAVIKRLRVLEYWCNTREVQSYTVEPSNNGHIGDECFVHYSEVVPSSEVLTCIYTVVGRGHAVCPL